jgi:cellulose synthase (UDP-forming)
MADCGSGHPDCKLFKSKTMTHITSAIDGSALPQEDPASRSDSSRDQQVRMTLIHPSNQESLEKAHGKEGSTLTGSKESEHLTRQKIVFAFLVAAVAVAFADVVRWLLGQDLFGFSFGVSVAIFSAFFALPLFQMLVAYYLMFRFSLRASPVSEAGLRVDVYVTVFDEPLWLVEKTLQGALAIRYPHETYLLDDGKNELYAALAQRLGAGYLRREDKKDFKAGNLNHALQATDGDFIAIFDVDHTPRPDFLDQTLGFFSDPEMGFVQAMVTFSNHGESLVAKASAETALDFYNLTAVGKDRCGAASLIGSNAVIRRRALEETGLYKPGLAEDLETSLSLHAGGWRSAYVREPLAPGLSPSDLIGFWKQQLKWSSGVFEAAMGSFRKTFFKLTQHQKLCYLVRFTYYLFGVSVFMNLLALTVALSWPFPNVDGLILKLLPVMVASWISRVYPLRVWALEPLARKGLFFSGSSLFLITWPVYVLSAVCTVLRIRIPFIATPKEASGRIPLWIILPQMLMLAALIGAIAWRIQHWEIVAMPVTVALATFSIISHWMLFVGLVGNSRRTSRIG